MKLPALWFRKPTTSGRAIHGVARRLVGVAYGGDRDAARRVKLLREMNNGQTADEALAMRSGAVSPSEAFHRLRWGGRLLLGVPNRDEAQRAADALRAHGGYRLEAGPNALRIGPGGLPWVGRRWHYLLARKVELIAPGEHTDRFTFNVRLEPQPTSPHGYAVVKQVPTYKRVVERLRDRFPEAPQELLFQRADKLVKRVFPVFLTREVAFLQLLQRDLPEAYRQRVPRALAVEKAPNGTVKKLYMTWLRLGGEAMSQLEFAEQSMDLLRAIHEHAGVMHLDLRMDNMVVHRGRVCFVDFGSSVRIGEDLEKSPMLRSLFDEMMQTSQIQRTLGKMKDSGHLTSDVLAGAHGRVDPGIDLFYLALQISRPYWNPDLVPFIRYDKQSESARKLKKLTDAILRPLDPNRPRFVSAKDVLAGVRKIRSVVRDDG